MQAITYQRSIIIFLVMFTLLAAWAEAGTKWITYENCKLIPNESNDGDSFHVKTETFHYIFRLYFVDTPETDDRYPDRIKEQADYFGISEDKIETVGKDATRFSEKILSDGFTVYTKKVNARGNSKQNRYFAMIEVDGDWLSTLLVEEGLARIYGNWSELPDGLDSRKHQARLRVKEKAAKRARKGAWAHSKRSI